MTGFCAAFQRLRQDLDQSHRDRTQTIEEVRAEVKDQTAHAARTLAEQARTRRAEFHTFMHGLQQGVQGQAAKQGPGWPRCRPTCAAGGAFFRAADPRNRGLR